MQTYKELFRSPEFGPLFAVATAQVAGVTVSGLALGTLVFGATGSPLLSALSMFGPSLVQMVGAMTLLSAADRMPPRAALTGLALASAVAAAALSVPGLPGWVMVLVVVCQGLIASVGGGVRYGLLSEILPADGFLIGRSVLNMSAGGMQILGFAVGAGLVALLSPRGTLLIAALLYVVAAGVAVTRIAPRPARASGRPSVAETWRVNTHLLSLPARRYVFIAMWVPNGLVVGCEALFVSYDPERAGLLLAFGACGMLVGDIVAGRFITPIWRRRLAPWLRLLLPAPYLVFAFEPTFPIAAVAVFAASIGFCATLLLQEQLMALTPGETQGQALGLQSSGMLAMQGVAAALAGTVAQHTSPATGMTVMAACSVAVTLALAPKLRPGRAMEPRPAPPPEPRPAARPEARP
jgi:predicted MFS family arabinose efflux permease